MTAVLETIYSLPFAVGALIGAIVMRLYQKAQCRLADKRHPLPGGRKHRVPGVSTVWVGGLITVLVLGYVLLLVAQTEQHYKSLASEMRRCQIEFQTALIARSRITTENDQLSREQRDLLAESDQAESVWIDRLINLPSNIKELPQDDPRVTSYGQTVTRIYFERIGRINSRITEIDQRQAELDRDRTAHPLPEPSCGK